ncbi:hypothetical protein [Azospirillum sp. sgz302134]
MLNMRKIGRFGAALVVTSTLAACSGGSTVVENRHGASTAALVGFDRSPVYCCEAGWGVSDERRWAAMRAGVIGQ